MVAAHLSAHGRLHSPLSQHLSLCCHCLFPNRISLLPLSKFRPYHLSPRPSPQPPHWMPSNLSSKLPRSGVSPRHGSQQVTLYSTIHTSSLCLKPYIDSQFPTGRSSLSCYSSVLMIWAGQLFRLLSRHSDSLFVF